MKDALTDWATAPRLPLRTITRLFFYAFQDVVDNRRLADLAVQVRALVLEVVADVGAGRLLQEPVPDDLDQEGVVLGQAPDEILVGVEFWIPVVSCKKSKSSWELASLGLCDFNTYGPLLIRIMTLWTLLSITKGYIEVATLGKTSYGYHQLTIEKDYSSD